MIVGDLPDDLTASLERFRGVLSSHPWGGSVGRLIVADDLKTALSRWMQPDEFAAWEALLRGRPVTTAAKTFLAHDLTPTAVIPRWFEHPNKPFGRELFLAFAAHELIHSAHLRLDGLPQGPESSERILARAWFDEYRVERVRMDLWDSLGWATGGLDTHDPGLADQANPLSDGIARFRIEAASSLVVPEEVHLHFQNLVYVWAGVLGRADGGDVVAAHATRSFLEHPVAREASTGWTAATRAFREAWAHPNASFADRSCALEAGAAEPLFRALRGCLGLD